MTDTNYDEFNAIVDSYMPVAEAMFLSRAHVEAAVGKAATRSDMAGQCPSCQFSRAMDNGDADVLTIYKRRCVLRQPRVCRCPRWERLEVPKAGDGTCGLGCGKPKAPDDWVCSDCREHLDGLSPRTKKANQPGGGTGHGHLRRRRANSGY